MRLFLTKCFEFEMSHRLAGHQGNCANLHGHSYKLQVTLETNTLKRLGMGIDFSDVKKLVRPVLEKYDHACITSIDNKYTSKPYTQVNPTAEMMAADIMSIIKDELAQYAELATGVRVHKITLWETSTSYVELVNENESWYVTTDSVADIELLRKEEEENETQDK